MVTFCERIGCNVANGRLQGGVFYLTIDFEMTVIDF